MTRLSLAFALISMATIATPAAAAPARAAICADDCCRPYVYYLNRPCHDRCHPQATYRLAVCHPCTGCPVEVDVCLPACCSGAPCVSGRRTIFGAGLVHYDWDCGYGVTIRFMKCGDLKVAYR